MGERRKQQNYQALPHLLTEEVWDCLMSAPRHKARSVLFCHAWKLGLRCPSEGTFNTMFHLVALCSKEQRQMTMFERYTTMNEMKKEWKSFKSLRKGDDLQYQEYIDILSSDPQDLPGEYYLDAFSSSNPTPCSSYSCTYLRRFSLCSVCVWFAIVHLKLYCQSVLRTGG